MHIRMNRAPIEDHLFCYIITAGVMNFFPGPDAIARRPGCCCYYMISFLLILCCITEMKILVSCSRPGPVVICANGSTNCTVSNAYGVFPDRSTCRAAEVAFPSTESELLAVVAHASRKNQKMRVVSRYSHSIPKLVCPGGDSGLIISTRDLKRVMWVNESTMRMHVESGLPLKDLIDAAAKAGLALPHSPYWLGVTVGGMLGTGAHGSSLFGKGSAVHEYVVGIRLVVPASATEGYAKVVSLTEADQDDLNAAKVSLGLLGVISQVTVELQPMFKRSIANMVKNDSDLENRILQFGMDHEFGDVTWYPSQARVVYRVDDRVPMNSSGDGTNDFIGFRPTLATVLRAVRRREESQEASKNDKWKCASSKLQVSALLNAGTGLKNNNLVFSNYPVIGYQYKLQASGSCLASIEDALLTTCPWDPRVNGEFFHQTTVSINISKIKQFLLDVKKLRDIVPRSLCGTELYSGFLMRYVKASSAYLGKQDDSVDIDITYYRSHDPNTPLLHEDVLEEIEQMALLKYGGLPHWGKNRNLAFDGVISKYTKFVEFLRVRSKYDPKGLFSSEWTDAILGIGKERVVIIKDRCALEGLCICSQDVHCAPAKGYFCRPGRVYTEAHVCRHETT